MKLGYRSVVGTMMVSCTGIASMAGAQTKYKVPMAEGEQVASLGNVQGKTPPQNSVTLAVRDSSVLYVIREIARQSAVRVSFNPNLPQFQAKVSLRVNQSSALETITLALRETGLTAVMMPDGRSIVVRPKEVAQPQDTVKQVTGRITGTVTDSTSRKGIDGVTVMIVGTRISTMTRDGGRFQFTNVPSGELTLSAKLLGYQSKMISIAVSDKEPVRATITMQQSSTTLSEVVTTATGKQRRIEVASDIVKINVDSLMQRAPIMSVTDILTVARVPGVEVTPSSGLPGAPSRIRFRGVGNINGNNDPVVYVDGVRLSAPSSTEDVMNLARVKDAQADEGHISRNALVPSRIDDIDPSFIESIEFLKGPSAASLYGMDAANGVILITTRKGLAGPSRWTVDVKHAIDFMPGQYQPIYTGYGTSPTNGLPLQGSECARDDVIAVRCLQDSVSSFNMKNSPFSTDEARRGRSTNYSANLSGGGQALQYYFGVAYQDMLGATKTPTVDLVRLRLLGERIPSALIRPDNLSRTSFSINLTATPRRDLQLSFGIQGGRSKTRSAGLEIVNPLGFVLPFEDTLTFMANGNRIQTEALGSENMDGQLSFTAAWNPLSWVTANLEASLHQINRHDSRSRITTNCTAVGACALPVMSFVSVDAQRSVYSMRAYAPLRISLGRFERLLTVRPTIGGNLWRQLEHTGSFDADSITPGSTDPAMALERNIGLIKRNTATGSVFADMTLGLLQRFYTTVGVRQDLGSALRGYGKGSLGGTPRFSISYPISEESFFPKTTILPALRLRIAIDKSTVQPDAIAVRGGYQVAPGVINGQAVSAIEYFQIGNVNLEPTQAYEIEYGFDATLFQDRTSLVVTVANKWNRNQYLKRSLAPSIGFSTQFTENIARVYNRSVEISVDHRVIQQKRMMWDVSMSFASTFNRVQRLGNLLPFGGVQQRIVEGYPINGVWLLPILLYSDVDGDGALETSDVVVGDSIVYAGWNFPRYTMTYRTTLSLLNNRLTLAASVNYDGPKTQRQLAYDGWGIADPFAPLSEQAKAFALNSGLAHPALSGANAGNLGNPQTISTLRLGTLSAQLALPSEWARRLRARDASVALQGSNLGMWSRYRGRDPGVNSSPIGDALADNGTTLPQPRKFLMNVRLYY